MPEPRPIGVQLTSSQRRVIAEVLPEFSDRLKLEQKNSRSVSFTAEELGLVQQAARQALSTVTNGLQRNSLRHVVAAAVTAVLRAQGIGRIPGTQRIYQFRIALLDAELAVWRRIQVRNETLDRLHVHIQTAMGWTNSHLHEFDIDGERYGDPLLLDDGFEDFHCVNTRTTYVSDIIPDSGERFRFSYEYDFGDAWLHEVLFEGCLKATPGERYPICVEGVGACPPEDVGGITGYSEFLAAIADPDHEQHAIYREWAGPFDPQAFDARRATSRMRRGLPDWQGQ
jgi:hypothetical protein